jgi:type III secretion protein R
MTDSAGLVLLIVAFGLAPFVALMTTSYAKLVIVFGLLRSALGVQQVPPNIVLNGIAIILTIYIMAPVGMDAADTFKRQRQSSQSSTAEVLFQVFDASKAPLQQFLQKHTKEHERRFFLKSARAIWPAERAQSLGENDLMVLVPSFTLSELTKAFQIGFVVYLVFVVVDLIVANVLLALGMQMISPTTISVPFKLLLFVVLDGWSLLTHSLILSYK